MIFIENRKKYILVDQCTEESFVSNIWDIWSGFLLLFFHLYSLCSFIELSFYWILFICGFFFSWQKRNSFNLNKTRILFYMWKQIIFCLISYVPFYSLVLYVFMFVMCAFFFGEILKIFVIVVQSILRHSQMNVAHNKTNDCTNRIRCFDFLARENYHKKQKCVWIFNVK